jgi:hypothetical protein
LGVGIWDSAAPSQRPVDGLVKSSIEPVASEKSGKSSRKTRTRGFYAVEDILGHLLYVTWSLEEARQLAASVVLSGKVQRHLVAIRRIAQSMAQPPSTESGDKPKSVWKGPPPEIRITNSGSTSGLTLGYYVEKHYNLSKVDLKSVRRVRMGDHLATLASSKKTLDILGLNAPKKITDQIIALWHPVSEVANGGSDFMGTRMLNCDRRLLSLRYGIK